MSKNNRRIIAAGALLLAISQGCGEPESPPESAVLAVKRALEGSSRDASRFAAIAASDAAEALPAPPPVKTHVTVVRHDPAARPASAEPVVVPVRKKLPHPATIQHVVPTTEPRTPSVTLATGPGIMRPTPSTAPAVQTEPAPAKPLMSNATPPPAKVQPAPVPVHPNAVVARPVPARRPHPAAPPGAEHVVARTPDPARQPIDAPGLRLTATTGWGTLKQVAAAYQSHNTLSARIQSEVFTNFGRVRRFGQETEVSLSQSPPAANVRVRDPFSGTTQYFANGRTVVRHSALVNAYTKRTVFGGLTDIAAYIDRNTPSFLGPLSLVAAKERPTGVATARLAGDAVVNGRKTAIVTGTLEDGLVSRLSNALLGRRMAAKQKTYQLWIDRATSVILRVELHLSWAAGGTKSVSPALRIVEQWHDARFDMPLRPETFTYTPNANAREMLLPDPSF